MVNIFAKKIVAMPYQKTKVLPIIYNNYNDKNISSALLKAITSALFFSASADNRGARPSRTRTAPAPPTDSNDNAPDPVTTVATPSAAATEETQAPPAAEAGLTRKLKPHRLALRRNRPGEVAASTTTVKTPAAPADIEPPQLEEDLVKHLNGEVATTAATEEESTPRPRARFALPPRRGAKGTQSSADGTEKSNVAAEAAAPPARRLSLGGLRGNRANTAPASTTTEAPEDAQPAPAGGINRLRNARIGGSRHRVVAAAAGTPNADSTAAPAEDDTKSAGKLSLAERRSRFSNARLPPKATQIPVAEDATHIEETAAGDEVAETTDVALAGSSRKNGRRFPSLSRQSS